MKGRVLMRTFDELYEEYAGCISVQKSVIEYYREKLRQEIKNSNMKEVKRLNSLLCVLYAEKSELEERAAGIGDYVAHAKSQEKIYTGNS